MLLCDRKKIVTWIDNVLKSLSFHGIYILIGSEIEFYLRANNLIPSEDKIAAFSSYISTFYIKEMLKVEKEKGAGQYEIPINYTAPIDAMVFIDYTRDLIESSAKKFGMDAIFSAKPFKDDYGSALHLHVSIHDVEGKNLFSDNHDFMESIIFSILDLIERDLDFICNEEDLERFKEGWMAPSHVCWGGNNRTAAIRIPHDKSENKRFEFRVPSANSDQYKVLLFILIGVLKSAKITNKYTKIYGNAYDEQYSLQRLQFCNNIEEKNFIDVHKVDALVENLCKSAVFKL